MTTKPDLSRAPEVKPPTVDELIAIHKSFAGLKLHIQLMTYLCAREGMVYSPFFNYPLTYKGFEDL